MGPHLKGMSATRRLVCLSEKPEGGGDVFLERNHVALCISKGTAKAQQFSLCLPEDNGELPAHQAAHPPSFCASSLLQPFLSD